MKRSRAEEGVEENESESMAICLMLLSRVHNESSSPERVFQCKTCNRQFSTFQALGGHRAIHKQPVAIGALRSSRSNLGKLHEWSTTISSSSYGGASSSARSGHWASSSLGGDQWYYPPIAYTHELEASTQIQFIPASTSYGGSHHIRASTFQSDDEVHIPVHDETYEPEIDMQAQISCVSQASDQLRGRRGRKSGTFLTITSQALLTFLATQSNNTTSMSQNAIFLLYTAVSSFALSFLLCFCCFILCSRKPAGGPARTMTAISHVGTALGFTAIMAMHLPDFINLWIMAVAFFTCIPLLFFAINN